MLSAYPTKHARIGNAVGLDTPASAVALLRRLRDEGWQGIDGLPGLESGDGDELIHALIEAGGHDQDWLTEEQLARNPIRIPAADYRRWFEHLPAELRARMRSTGARRRVRCSSTGHDPEGDIVLAPCAAAISWSSSSRRAASARTRSRSTTTPTCRPRTTTSRPTAGSPRGRRTAASAPTR